MSLQKTAAVIGLGSMGSGMAGGLIRSGMKTRCCDTNPLSLSKLVQSGGIAAETPAVAAAGVSMVAVVVVNAEQTDEVLFGKNGALETMTPGAVILSCATMSPEYARDFAARAAKMGILYLDAPISGGSVKAAEGRLTVMASGSPEAFSAARPILAVIAETVYELGDEAGIGSSFKMINQLLAGVHIAAACEAIVLAKSLDLDLDRVFEVIKRSAGNSWMFENRIPHVLAGDYSPHSSVAIFTKDLGIVSDIGREQKFPLPIASAALQLFMMTEAAGMGADDDASVARLLAKICELNLPSTAL